jgi:hypothetical protein
MLKKWLISSLQTIGLALLAIVAFEFASYHLLPFRFTRFAPNYKLVFSSASSLNEQVEIAMKASFRLFTREKVEG